MLTCTTGIELTLNKYHKAPNLWNSKERTYTFMQSIAQTAFTAGLIDVSIHTEQLNINEKQLCVVVMNISIAGWWLREIIQYLNKISSNSWCIVFHPCLLFCWRTLENLHSFPCHLFCLLPRSYTHENSQDRTRNVKFTLIIFLMLQLAMKYPV